jgi:hypothetical protein
MKKQKLIVFNAGKLRTVGHKETMGKGGNA